MAEIKIEGLDEVIKAMLALPDAIVKNGAAYAMRKGANVIAKEAKARAPVLKSATDARVSGLTRQKIAVRKRKKRGPGIALAYSVGVLGGASLKNKSTKKTRKAGTVGQDADLKTRPAYWRFLEFGTEKLAAKPFLRPAFDAKAEEAVKAIADGFRTGLTRAVTKALKS